MSSEGVPCLLLSDDMLFSSRIIATARSLQIGMHTARNDASLEALARDQAPRCVIIDLANPGLEIADLLQHLRELCPHMPRVVAYGSHVDAATLQLARQAGCDLVMPRSQFVAELPGSLARWVTGD